MKTRTKTAVLEQNVSRLFKIAVIITLVMVSVLPGRVSAAAGALTARKLTLGSSAISGSDREHKFDFTLSGTDNLGSIKFEYCTAASGACGTVTGLDTDGATLDAQTGATGFTVDATTTTSTVIGITRTAASASGAVSYTFSGIVNPSTANSTFYVRITTYTAANFSGADDTGTVAAATAEQITLSGTMDESLVFCVGTSITGTDCGTVSGSAVNFGSFSSTATRSGTSVMAASTNGVSGYSITVNGSTLTCAACSGTPTIAALATQTASSTGSAQFGVNLKDNATPNVGAEVSGTGSATATANYGTADQFRFVTGDSVASAGGATNANTFTASYIVNVPGSQAAGTYTATMTYIATATF